MSLPYLKNVNEQITQIISEETGEVIDVQTKVTTVVASDREQFIQIYTSLEAKLSELTLSEERVLFYCIFHCDDTNTIKFGTYDKKLISKKWGLEEGTVSNCITKLHRKGLVVRIDRAAYRVNPIYAWRNTSNTRKQTLKHFLTVECPHC